MKSVEVTMSERGSHAYDPDADLRELREQISRRKVPVGALTRLWSLGNMQAAITLKYIDYWLRGLFAGDEQKEKLLSETRVRAALKLFSTMGYLRGAVMKVGQVLGHLPHVMPDEVAEILGSLHFEAPPMHYALIREVFYNETGKEPQEVFAEFEKKPFAAASLGQVHRARLPSGERVAVKIQYPHMAEAVRADMRNLKLILSPLRLSSDWGYIMDGLNEIEEMLIMEADYRHEAAFCRRAKAMFEPEERVVIPKIFAEYSGPRILTMEYIPGRHLKEFLATNPSQAQRDNFVDLLSLISLRLYYGAEQLFADPNPGNFIFMDDGRLGLIDFGCTRVFSEEEWQLHHDMEEAFLLNNDKVLNDLLAQTCYLHSAADMTPEHLHVMRNAISWHLEPMKTPGLFDWSDEVFFRRGLDIYSEMIGKRYTKGSPLYIWANRFIFGFRALCYRLQGGNYFNQLYKMEKARGRRLVYPE